MTQLDSAIGDSPPREGVISDLKSSNRQNADSGTVRRIVLNRGPCGKTTLMSELWDEASSRGAERILRLGRSGARQSPPPLGCNYPPANQCSRSGRLLRPLARCPSRGDTGTSGEIDRLSASPELQPKSSDAIDVMNCRSDKFPSQSNCGHSIGRILFAVQNNRERSSQCSTNSASGC